MERICDRQVLTLPCVLRHEVGVAAADQLHIAVCRHAAVRKKESGSGPVPWRDGLPHDTWYTVVDGDSIRHARNLETVSYVILGRTGRLPDAGDCHNGSMEGTEERTLSRR